MEKTISLAPDLSWRLSYQRWRETTKLTSYSILGNRTTRQVMDVWGEAHQLLGWGSAGSLPSPYWALSGAWLDRECRLLLITGEHLCCPTLPLLHPLLRRTIRCAPFWLGPTLIYRWWTKIAQLRVVHGCKCHTYIPPAHLENLLHQNCLCHVPKSARMADEAEVRKTIYIHMFHAIYGFVYRMCCTINLGIPRIGADI